MAITFKLKGIAAIRAKLDALALQSVGKMEGALRLEAEQIMTRSKQEFVPVDVGTLRGSGTVLDAVRKGKDVSVTMTFGGAAAPYAAAVHEHPSPQSPPSWQGRTIEFKGTPQAGPKYLHRPLQQAVDGMATRLAAAMKV